MGLLAEVVDSETFMAGFGLEKVQYRVKISEQGGDGVEANFNKENIYSYEQFGTAFPDKQMVYLDKCV